MTLTKRDKRTGGNETSIVTYLESEDQPGLRKIVYGMAKELKIRYVDVREIVDATVEVIAECVSRGHRVVLKGFGRFEAPRHAPRLVWDHWRAKHYMWEGGNRCKFRPSNDWVSQLNDEPIQAERLRYRRLREARERGQTQEA